MQLSEGKAEYHIRRRTRKSMKNEFFKNQL